ncbi:PQQ-binding-like beta-propeller repeat protein [Candidatus Bathyarchaeota archaeon]|nr:PQQ-binding-like beta-propeller repeat protein [Candidatus Bathyarchaeota archaeon]
MGIRKRLLGWCQRPANTVSVMIRRHTSTFAVLITTAVLLVSFFLISSGSLLPTPPIAPKLPQPPTDLWDFTASNSTANTISLDWGNPLVSNGIVYLCAAETYVIPSEPPIHPANITPSRQLGTIYALNKSNGVKLWNLTAQGNIRYLTVIDGVTYISASDGRYHNGQYGGGNIFALDAGTGSQKWVYKIDGDVLSSIISDGVVYVFFHASFTLDSYVCAVNASNGRQLWRYNAGYHTYFSSPAFDDDAIYFGTYRGNYYAVSAKNGSELWNVAVDGRVSGSSTLFDGIVYFNSDDTTYALNAQTGEKLWSYPITQYQIGDAGISYFKAGENVYALNASNGNQIWKFSANETIISSLSLIDNVIYFCTNETLTALNPANGAQLWSCNTEGDAPLAIYDGRVSRFNYIQPNAVINEGALYYYSGKTLFALDASNGKSLWNYTAVSNWLFLTVANDMVFFSVDNTVYALSGSAVGHPS